MPEKRPGDAQKADFLPEKRVRLKRYTGATVALRLSYGELTDSLTPKRH